MQHSVMIVTPKMSLLSAVSKCTTTTTNHVQVPTSKPNFSRMGYIEMVQVHSKMYNNKYFELKKPVGRRWGAPNSNYLPVTVSTFVMPFSRDPRSPRMTPDASCKSSTNASGL